MPTMTKEDTALLLRMARAMQVWHVGRPMHPMEVVADNYWKFAQIALKEMRAETENT